MTREFDFLNGVGLRHVIRDALGILSETADFDSDRRQYVLKDLAGMVSNAKRYSDLGQSNTSFIGASNDEALEIVSLLERQLGGTKTPWQDWLGSANQVFDSLLNQQPVADEPRKQTISLLEAVLVSLANRPVNVSGPAPYGDTFGMRA